jgi:glycogen synthase
MSAISHVLMTADAVGGVWTYALDLARALGVHGVRVSLALLGPAPSAAQRADATRLTNVELYEHPGRLEWMDDPWADVDAAGAWLLALEQQLEPAIVHLNGYALGALPWSSPVVVVGHSCVLSWWQAVHGEQAPPRWREYANRVRRGLEGASLVVTPSGAMLTALQAHYGPLPQTCVIPNGRSGVSTRELKEPFVLTAGRLWDAAKNVDAVCAIAADVDWPVFVAGPSDAPAHAIGASNGGANCARPRFLGSLPAHDLAGYMARASIFVLPARYEPFGLAVLEAALARCALVLGDIGSLREIWHDAAIFVAPDNRRQLAWTVKRLIEDDRLRVSMAARARARARQFETPRMAARYLHAYEELIGERRSVLPFRAVGLESR